MLPRNMQPRQVRAVATAAGIMAIGTLACIALISSSNLGRVELKGKHSGGSKAHKARGSFVLNYLQSNSDVDEGPTSSLAALSPRAIRREGRRNVDDLGMHFKSLRQSAVGPDGLSDPGDISDISLLHQLGGEMHSDALVADSIDYSHRASRDATLGFSAGQRTHDMGHAAAAVDERETMGVRSGAFGSNFHALSGVDNRDVDALGGAEDSDVFSMVRRATARPSVQDVDVGRAAAAALRGTDSLSPRAPRAVRDAGAAERRALRHSAAMASLESTRGDSESEGSDDPRQEQMREEREEAASTDKGIWIEPGSGKGGDSFALDSLQVKETA